MKKFVVLVLKVVFFFSNSLGGHCQVTEICLYFPEINFHGFMKIKIHFQGHFNYYGIIIICCTSMKINMIKFHQSTQQKYPRK